MFSQLKAHIVDRWITWRTGKDRAQREWEAWYKVNVNYRADRIKDMFKNFEYIIEVNPDKFFDPCEPFAWVPVQDARQYFWPDRKLDENCVWRFERVIKAPSTNNEWHLSELGGSDHVFVATNNKNDAIMLTLMYS